MNNYYFFSDDFFEIHALNTSVKIYKDIPAKLSCAPSEVKLTLASNFDEKKELKLSRLPTFSGANVICQDGDYFCNIIFLNLDACIELQKSKSAKVYFYSGYLRVLFSNKFYSHSFKTSNNNYVIEDSGVVYIFNNEQMLIFFAQNISFYSLSVKTFKASGNLLEMLCRVPKTNNYFLLFKINTELNKVSVKKLKQHNVQHSSFTLPYVLFNLLKCNLESEVNFCDKSINLQKLKSYFLGYEKIMLIDNYFYLIGSRAVSKIKFSTLNNCIYEID